MAKLTAREGLERADGTRHAAGAGCVGQPRGQARLESAPARNGRQGGAHQGGRLEQCAERGVVRRPLTREQLLDGVVEAFGATACRHVSANTAEFPVLHLPARLLVHVAQA